MFIDKQCSLMSSSAIAQPIFYVNYQLAAFQMELFAQHNIQASSRILSSVKKRQAEYLAGRLCARSALEAIGIFDFSLLSAADRAPIWPSNVTGSITHSGSHAAAWVCSTEHCLGLGVDIEKVIDSQRYDLTEQICSAEEIAYLHTQTESLGFDSLVTLVFSAKESLFKALYPLVKQFFYFDAAHITSIDISRQLIELRVVNDIGGGVCDTIDNRYKRKVGDKIDQASVGSHAGLEKVPAGSCFYCHYQAIGEDYFLTYCMVDSL